MFQEKLSIDYREMCYYAKVNEPKGYSSSTELMYGTWLIANERIMTGSFGFGKSLTIKPLNGRVVTCRGDTNGCGEIWFLEQS